MTELLQRPNKHATNMQRNVGDFTLFRHEQSANTEEGLGSNSTNSARTSNEHALSDTTNTAGGYGPRRGPTPGACVRARLTGTNVAKAGQILAILQRIANRIDTSEAERMVRQAMEGNHDPKEVLAALLTVAAECRGEKTYQGKSLANVAYGVMGELVEGERRAA